MQDWTRKGKNKLVSDPSYRRYGDKNWMRQPQSGEFRARVSEQLKADYASGRRVPLRAAMGRIAGHRICE
jgi:hypothetical protein